MVNNYFVRNILGNRTLFAVVTSGSRYAETSRTILKPMEKVEGEWKVRNTACPIVVVFGKAKGFSAKVSDAEIMDLIVSNNPKLSKAEIEKDFKELRNYFNEPTCSEVETWHQCGATIIANELWTPYEVIPTEGF